MPFLTPIIMRIPYYNLRLLLSVSGAAALLVTGAFTMAAPQEKQAPQARISASTLPPPGIYDIDGVHTFVEFAAQHLVVGMVRGRFDNTSGRITITADPATCAVNVSIEAASVSTHNTYRDEDLRSKDFLDAADHPAITYQATGFQRAGDHWTVDGTLTIRGIAKVVPLVFDFKGTAPKVEGKPDRIAFQATAATKRADFGMTRELIDEIGPSHTGPDVWIEIDTEALSTGTSDR